MSDVPELFDFLNSISNKTKLYDSEELAKYPEFMVNRFIAHGNDTIFFANECSKMSNIPKYLQYLFLYYGINKKKRYFKYQKGAKSEKIIQHIKEYFNVRDDVAMEYYELLSKEQLKEIKELFEKKVKRS